MVCSAVEKKTTLKGFVRNHQQILKSQTCARFSGSKILSFGPRLCQDRGSELVTKTDNSFRGSLDTILNVLPLQTGDNIGFENSRL